MLKYTLLLIALLNYSLCGAAGLTDSNVHARPASPPSFGANFKAADTTFGTTVMRVTGAVGSNAYDEGGNVRNVGPVQHFTLPWNKDSDHFIVWWDTTYQVAAASRVREYAFNGDSFTISGYTDMKGITGGDAGTEAGYLNYNRYLFYSATESRVVYGIKGTNDTLAKYDFSTSTGSALSPQPNWLTTFSGNNLDGLIVSEDNNRFGFWVGTNNTGIVYVVWSAADNAYDTLDITPTTSGGPWTSGYEPKPGSCFLSRSGDYLRIIGRQAGDSATQNYIYPITVSDGTVTIGEPSKYEAGSPNYVAGKMSTYHSLNVNEDASGGAYSYRLIHRSWATPTTVSSIFQTNSRVFCHPAYSPGGSYVSFGSIAFHPILTAWTNHSGNVYKTTPSGITTDCDYLIYKSVSMTKVGSAVAVDAAGKYYYDTSGNVLYAWVTGDGEPCDYDVSGTCMVGGDWTQFMDEIILAKTDGSAPNNPIRLAHSWTNFYTNSWDEMPSGLSPDNRYVVWYGNWNGSGRHDVFIVNTGLGIGNATATGVTITGGVTIQ